MEGSIRQAGAKVRIAVQLVDAVSGASLWAETYDRAVSTRNAILELLDEWFPASWPPSPTRRAFSRTA
jgi:TolB-like protein